MGGANPIININISGVTSAENLIDKIISESAPFMDHFTKLAKDHANPGKLIIYDEREFQYHNPDRGFGIVDNGVVEDITITTTNPTNVSIQAGANKNQLILLVVTLLTYLKITT